MAKARAKQLVVCVDNDGYLASLELRKIYVALRDIDAEKHDLIRIVDESGEDYLYPKAFFRVIALPQAVRRAVLAVGDGIMSAIDFDMAIERQADPKGDRVKIGMTGKFLPFRYYGAKGNEQALGYREE